MKSLFAFIFLALVLTGSAVAQTPDKINYQAVVRGTTGAILQNQVIGLRISILQGSDTGPAVFAETHTPTTNAYGLINVQIGTGTNLGPLLNTIDWGADIYYMAVQIDPAGGTSYSILSTTQLVSVPYALHARTVEENDDADADPLNETNTGASLVGSNLQITDNGGTLVVDLSPLEDDADADPTNEAQTISKVGNIITLSSVGGVGGGAITDDVNDADASPTNELNTGFNLVGSTLSITDAGSTQSVSLAGLIADGSATNELNTSATLVGTTLNITDAGGTLTVNLSSLVDADGSTTNELNTSATLVGTTLNITDAGGTLTVNLSSLVDADGSTTNELNTSATLVGTTLNITDAGGTLAVNLSSLVDADGSTTNELNTSASLVGTTLNITDAGGTLTVNLSSLEDDADADPSNELQTLTLVGSDLTISGGNTITLGGGTDSQILSVVGSDLTISNGNTITLPGAVDTDDQTLSILGSDLTIAGGNTVTLPSQTLSIVGSDLTISGGNTVTLPGGADTDDQTLSIVGADLTIADGNTITLPVQTRFVGEHHEGGIVVFVDSTGQHGLICAYADLVGTFAFQGVNSATLITSNLTDGSVNTPLLVAAASGPYPAAVAADGYAGGGYTDWYLPSIYELELLLRSNYILGTSALKFGGTNFYWSSTQDPTAAGVNAYRCLGGPVAISSFGEANVHNVRCVRKF